MPHDLTHASFFSGVGGLDMGLERAGWRTVSFSEIDPYASAVLAERWPGVPNLGDITRLAADDQVDEPGGRPANGVGDRPHRRHESDTGSGRTDWRSAVLWSGGFPCQDLSVAGKRRGMGTDEDRTRSGLAYAFLDLVERHRPPAILLENVPGLLSSNGGKDLGALLGRLGNFGYWWAYRILDAQFFGVPQRRRRVFICALHAGAGFGADSAAAVLSVGARCGGHSQAGDEAGEGTARRPAPGIDIARAITGTSGKRHDDDTDTLIANGLRASDGHHGYSSPRGDGGDNLLVSPAPDPGGMRAPSRMARWVDDLAPTLTAPDTRHRIEGGKRQDGSRRDRIPVTLAPTLRVGPQRPQDGGPGDTVPIIAATLNSGGNDGGFRTEPGDVRTTHAIVGGRGMTDDEMLPLGLDSHRYRCCGNGVASNMSEWIGVRLARAVQSVGERAA